MSTMLRAMIAGLTLACFISVAPAQQPGPEAETQEASLMCIHSILVMALAAGERNFPNEAAEFKATLRESIEKIDAFVTANRLATPEQVEALKSSSRAQVAGGASFSAAAGLYKHMQTMSAETLRAQVEQLLATPGARSMQPCP